MRRPGCWELCFGKEWSRDGSAPGVSRPRGSTAAESAARLRVVLRGGRGVTESRVASRRLVVEWRRNAGRL